MICEPLHNSCVLSDVTVADSPPQSTSSCFSDSSQWSYAYLRLGYTPWAWPYAVCSVLGILLWMVQIRKWKYACLPPGPKGVPVVGNLPMLMKSKRVHLEFDRLFKEFGSFYSLHLGVCPTVVLADTDIIREALVENADIFSDRPMWLPLAKLAFRGKGLIMQNDQAWKDVRKLTLKTMRDMGVGKTSLEEKIWQEAEIVCDTIPLHKTFSFASIFNLAASNVIGSILFGQRYEFDDPEFVKITNAFTLLCKIGGFQNPFFFLPWYTIPLIPILRPSQFQTFINFFYIRKVVTRRIRESKKTYVSGELRHFLDVYIKAQREEQGNGRSYTDQHLLGAILDLFLAGSETTSTTLLWIFLFMLKYPEVQSKCREEIMRVNGPQERPKWSARDQHPYLMATIMESQRIGNTVPVFPFHNTKSDVTLRGHLIPKNTLVMISLYSLHMNDKHWPNPSEFRPERFLLPEGGLNARPQHFMPFGTGRRQCLGDQLARMELFVFLSCLLRKFKFHASGPLPSIDDANFGITLIPNDYNLIAELVCCPHEANEHRTYP